MGSRFGAFGHWSYESFLHLMRPRRSIDIPNPVYSCSCCLSGEAPFSSHHILFWIDLMEGRSLEAVDVQP